MARAVLNGEIMYILRGTEHLKGGIEKSLQRIRGRDQTGNASYGAQLLRQHRHELDIEVLSTGQNSRAAEAAKLLKIAMVKLYDPPWNRPHLRRMERIRGGTNA